ncbi:MULTISPECIES: PIN domain-containing protein [Nocardia]|uniref:PIN domain-containing protein n=1 Tax=Nocardia TaxID=1817 RepID=UPI001E36A306|nr:MULTISPECIES: PIN domain-containing protein [Nocardia]
MSVLVDANVLYSRTLRDWLALLYLQPGNEMFAVRWTDDIMAEFHYHLRKNNPTFGDAQVGGIRRRLESVFATGRISGYEIDETITYPDPGDAHVHCAALHAGVDILLTRNVGDFTQWDDLPYEVFDCDEFFQLVDDSAPDLVRAVTGEQLVYHLRRSATGSISLPAMLRAAGAPAFGERVRRHVRSLDIDTLLVASSPPAVTDGR